MQIPAPAKRRVIPPGQPRLDRSNPLAWGLIGAYLPSAVGKTIFNLTGQGANLAAQSSAARGIGREGMGLKSTVATSGASVLTPSSQKPTSTASLYWRGVLLGNPLVNTADCIGVDFDNANTSPNSSFSISTSIINFSDIGLVWSNNGAAAQSATAPVFAANSLASIGGTFRAGGNSVLYSGGKVSDTTAFGAGPITYTATSTTSIGSYAGDATRASNIITYVAYMWNRELSAAEMESLDADPYQLLIFPQDDVMATLVGAAPASVSPTGAVATSAAGSPVPSVSITATGAQATSAAGTPSRTVSASPTGAAATSAAGTVTPSLSITATGAQATASAGQASLQIAGSASPAGAAATSAAGVPSKTIAVTAAGAQATSAAGSILPTITITATGASAASAAGSITVSSGAAAAPVGAPMSASAGSVSFQTSSSFTVAGASIQALAGSVTIDCGNTIHLTGLPAGGGFGTGRFGHLLQVFLTGLPAGGGFGAGSFAQSLPTSGSHAYQATYDDIISEAYDRLGLRIEAEGGHEVRSALRSINLIFSEWSNRGIRSFSITTTVQPISPAQTKLALPPGCIDVLECALRRNGRDLHMERKTRDEFLTIPNKDAVGIPHVFWVDRGFSPTLGFWQTTPYADDRIAFQWIRQFQDASASAQAPDLPYRWTEAICAALAASIAMKQLPERWGDMSARAEQSFDLAMEAERELGDIVLEPSKG